jgi:hypothetical protein
MARGYAVRIALAVACTLGGSAAAAPALDSPPASPGQPTNPPGYPTPAPGHPATHPDSAPSPYPPASPSPVQPVEASEGPLVPARPLAPGAHTHDGFLFRCQLGPGSGVISYGSSSTDYGGFAENIALGWALSPRIVLFGEIGGTLHPSASRVVGTYSLRAAYYFRNNLFVGGGLGAGVMRVAEDSEDGSSTDADSNKRASKMGLGLRSEVGQEYWVSANWALGWALNLAIAVAEDKEISGVTWTGVALAGVFSVTYN